MPLDTRLPLMAGAQAPIQFQPESQLQTLSRIAPAVNAMRQMQAQQSEMEQMRQRSAALDRLREAAQGQDLNIFADAMIASGISGLMEKGAKLKQEILLEADFKKRYGGFAGQPMSGESIRDITFAGREGARMAGAIAPFVLTPAQEEVPVGQNIYNRRTGEFKTPPPREAPANALVSGAEPGATATAGPQPQGRNRYITAGGSLYDTVDKKWLVAPEKAGGGGGGAAGAAPRPMTALQQQRLEEQGNARQTLSEELATVLGYYEGLEKQKAMVSTERSVGENVMAAARATGVGQVAERAMGTQAQTLRDNIANAKFRLVRHIAGITGASSKVMDSNKELQNWLDAMTNVNQSIQTVRETIRQLDRVIAAVKEDQAREDAAAGRQAAPAPASVPAPAARPGAAAPAPARTGGTRREIAPGVFVTERP